MPFARNTVHRPENGATIDFHFLKILLLYLKVRLPRFREICLKKMAIPKKGSIVLLLSALYGVIPAAAQQPEIKLDIYHSPASKYQAPPDSSKKKGTSSQQEINLSGKLPLFLRIDTSSGKIRSLGASGHLRYTHFNNTDYTRQILPVNLFASALGINYYSTLKRNWAYTLFINAGVNTDFREVDFNDVFLTGGVVFLKQFSKSFRLGVGVIVHNQFGTPMVWPALTADWKFGRKFKLDIRVPDEAQGIAYKIGIAYQLKKQLTAEFAFRPQAVSYDVTATRAIPNRLMNYWQLPFELNLQQQHGRIGWTGGVGFTALRRFAYSEKKLEKMFTSYPYHGLSSNWFVHAGINWRLK